MNRSLDRDATSTQIGVPVRPDRQPSGTAVFYLAADVADFMDRGLAAAEALPLTPAARSALQGSGWPIIDPCERFTDFAHAKAVARVKRARDRYYAVLGSSERLNDSAKHVAKYAFSYVSFSAVRLWITLGANGPWIVPADGKWIATDSRREAHQAMVRRVLLEADFRKWYPYKGPPFPKLFRLLRDLTLKLMPWSHASILTQRVRHPFGLQEELQRTGRPIRQYHVAPTLDGWLEYLRLGQQLLRAWRSAYQVQIKATYRPRGDTTPALKQAIDATRDEMIADGLTIFLRYLSWPVQLTDGLVEDMSRVVERIRPDLAIGIEV